jgi:large subunit ribosomal protein L27Ae
MDKFHPGYFGKVGMRRFHFKKNPEYCSGVNVDRLWSLIPSEVYEKAKNSTSDLAPVLDVTKLV